MSQRFCPNLLNAIFTAFVGGGVFLLIVVMLYIGDLLYYFSLDGPGKRIGGGAGVCGAVNFFFKGAWKGREEVTSKGGREGGREGGGGGGEWRGAAPKDWNFQPVILGRASTT